ncbi:zinc dependent phospholipase C family protein [Daejeonella sp.]|uniref:zinc dependent phospholipase C family protein n=1 Tax=Daejeonella sp. TaxID=2805397 RepID=UPI0030C34844
MEQKNITSIGQRILLLLLLIGWSNFSSAYSLLTHEAIIDVNWKKSIEPMLLKKYPGSSPEALLKAHSYAYGGAIMPDIGFSPFGSMFYTDLVHNVRTGDYIQALLEEAQDINEYAFALGSLAHYTADNYGHSVGTNVAVPLVYPKLKAKYGDIITYAEHGKSHSRVELSFDVLQTARGNYVTKNYHDFIGFGISTPLIERAFSKTYGLDVQDVFKSMSLAISTYRWVVKSLLPTLVRTAWANKKSELEKLTPGVKEQRFSYKMKNSNYYQDYGRELQKAGFIPTVLSVIIPILPKIGPLSKLRYKPPTEEVEKLFIRSFDSTLVNYERSLRAIQSGSPDLPNKALDTGEKTSFGRYSIADDTYAELLLVLQKDNFKNLSPALRANLVNFYKDSSPVLSTKKDVKKWNEIKAALASGLQMASEG